MRLRFPRGRLQFYLTNIRLTGRQNFLTELASEENKPTVQKLRQNR